MEEMQNLRGLKISCFAHPTTRIILVEYPILARPSAAAARPSQKPSSADISETESGIIDPLVSKRPEKIQNLKNL